jgi:hypothetical protein
MRGKGSLSGVLVVCFRRFRGISVLLLSCVVDHLDGHDPVDDDDADAVISWDADVDDDDDNDDEDAKDARVDDEVDDADEGNASVGERVDEGGNAIIVDEDGDGDDTVGKVDDVVVSLTPSKGTIRIERRMGPSNQSSASVATSSGSTKE